MELFPRGPIDEPMARTLVQRAWYVALGSGTVMLLGGLFTLSFNLLMGGIIVFGLGHGMIQRSWVASAALLCYLVGVLAQAGWSGSQPLLILLAIAVGYFLAQGFRATWWWRERSEAGTLAV